MSVAKSAFWSFFWHPMAMRMQAKRSIFFMVMMVSEQFTFFWRDTKIVSEWDFFYF